MMSNRAISTITRLAIHTVIRSHTFIWMAIGTGLSVIVMPFLLHGDGTAVSLIHIAIAYPSFTAFCILIVGTLWTSASLIACEVRDEQLQSVVVKPVRSEEIWLGKWLGIIAINAILVAATTFGIWLSVSIISRQFNDNQAARTALSEKVITARRIIEPEPLPELINKAERYYDQLISLGRISPATPFNQIYNDIKARYSMIIPGSERSWKFQTPGHSTSSAIRHSFRTTFRCNALERSPVSGIWSIKSGDLPSLTLPMNGVLDGRHHIMLPETFTPDSDTITLTYTHSPDNTTAIFFDPQTPVELMLHDSTFAANLVRSALAMFTFLAAIAAIGLTMSTIFSFPVATFATASILLILTLTSCFSEDPTPHHHGPQADKAFILKAAEPVMLAIKHATAGLIDNIPVHAISSGILFSWGQVVDCILVLLIIIPTLMGLASSMVLTRKEFAE